MDLHRFIWISIDFYRLPRFSLDLKRFRGQSAGLPVPPVGILNTPENPCDALCRRIEFP